MIRLFSVLAAILLTASPGSAHFLFVRILPPAEAGRFAEVVFSDKPDQGDPNFIDKISTTKLWLQQEPGRFEPLTTVKTSDRLRALLPTSGALSVIGQGDYGVLARANKPAFLLRHYPKAIAGDPKQIAQFAPKSGLPLEIMATVHGERLQFTALHDGKPLPAATLTVIDMSPKGTPLTAGKDGRATWQATPGNFAVYLGHTRKQPGEHDGQKYDEVRDFCSLSFTWPLERSGADPAALKLFQDALAARAAWTGFPGFTADVEAYVDGHKASGTVNVTPEGDVTVSTAEEVVSPWIKDRLDSIVLHRLPGPTSKATPAVYFGDEDTAHPLGRLVVFPGGKFASSYRVKDRQLMVVNRHLGKTNMTITIVENDQNAEGKVLPHSYTVQYWDAATGKLRRAETVLERWQRIGGIDLPVLLRVTESTEAGLSIKTLRLAGHKLLRPS
jgi:hypothetical protein